MTIEGLGHDAGIPVDHVREFHPRIQPPKSAQQISLQAIGKQIAEECKIRNLSANALAKKAGVSQRTVEKIMEGEARPSYDSLYRLANTLEITFLIGPS
jgi:ribosome-binding protein aMBF1 (putative translation factor)